MSTSTNKLLVTAAAAAATGALLAQPALELASSNPEEQLLARIAELQAEGGATPAGLGDPLRALAVVYQENDDHALAIAGLEQARYFTRAHQGLTSADEALLIRQQIRSEKALGLHQRVWNLQRATIARRHHDDARMLPIFEELADDWIRVVENVSAGELPPMIFLGCYYDAPLPRYDDARSERRPFVGTNPEVPGPSCTAGSRDVILRKLRSEILMYYADAIETILRTGNYASQELRQLERAALRVASKTPAQLAQPPGDSSGSFAPCFGGSLDRYLALEILDSCLAPVGRGGNAVVANVGGQVSLIRLIVYEIRSGASAAARASAVADLADWHVLAVPADRRRFDMPADFVLALYERAYREILQSGDLRASKEMFTPELPVTLPAYEPNPFVSATPESTRHVDVAFAVTKYGIAEQIEILDTSARATRAEERDLIRLIESTSFRPRAVDGALADSAPVTLRYDLDP